MRIQLILAMSFAALLAGCSNSSDGSGSGWHARGRSSRDLSRPRPVCSRRDHADARRPRGRGLVPRRARGYRRTRHEPLFHSRVSFRRGRGPPRRRGGASRNRPQPALRDRCVSRRRRKSRRAVSGRVVLPRLSRVPDAVDIPHDASGELGIRRRIDRPPRMGHPRLSRHSTRAADG